MPVVQSFEGRLVTAVGGTDQFSVAQLIQIVFIHDTPPSIWQCRPLIE
jgi:hypothetical protein